MFRLPPPVVRALDGHFTLVHVPAQTLAMRDPDERAAVRCVVTNGDVGLRADDMARLPSLELILSYGSGYEGIDLRAAQARGVVVTHAPGANAATVADHAIGMLLALMRDYVGMHARVADGQWADARATRPTLSGARVGIVGLGSVGGHIAGRATAFGAEIAYCTPTPHEGVTWRHIDSVLALAERSDVLVLACPGGPSTRHLVDSHVLEALGPDGYLINVARGSVVDTAALIAALDGRRIAGAGLDVVDGEPDIPAGLIRHPGVIITPHVAGRSPEATRRLRDILLENLLAHEQGRALRYVVAPR
ncbi:MAG: 2-hydroxyacid dehydrogenase [Paraburkholderia sp.]|jgi:D-3-phosphoglycerate dehydrogenase|nr:2-hydroxyacid dehydrogenase [Paraburkholderia sp.]